MHRYFLPNSRRLVEKGQTYRPMEQKRKFRARPTCISLTDFHKDDYVIQWRKNSLFKKRCWNNGHPYAKTFTRYTKIRLKWITDLIVKPKTIKFIEYT